MTITVYGAGAIGGITGARLARAGHDVLLVDRADDHVQHTKTKTGIWRDLAVRRRKTEVGALLGATVTKARTLGVAMPLTERLIAMIEDLELGRRVMSWSNIDELVAAGRRGA
jgi:2-dehydropantoate 2-reductase